MVLDQGFGDTKQIEVRLLGTYAPELGDPGGPETQDFVENWFTSRQKTLVRWNFIVTTIRMKTVDREQQSFNRWIGIITDINNTANLNADVIAFIEKNGYGHGIGVK